MNQYLKRLIELGAIVPGLKKVDEGFVLFERLSPDEIDSMPEEDLAYATKAMGRAIFTINEDGKITNYKGVDSHLDNEESASKNLVGAETIYFAADNTDYIKSNYPVNLLYFKGHGADIRIRGASPLEDLEIEGDINSKMQGKGIKLPKILEIKEFSQEFCEKYGLPLKVDGSFDQFNSDYADEDIERKKYLKEFYGDKYNEVIIEGKRPETVAEFFKRIKITEDSKIKQTIEENGMQIEDFINYVDRTYSLGQRYGQAVREIESPFRIADIEYYTKIGNKEVLENIKAFTESIYPDRVPFENFFAKQMGTNLANMMNNGWECENFSHRQDYAITGEMCDDSYVDVPHRLKAAERLSDTEPDRMKVEKSNIRLKFFLQTYLLSSNVKVIQDAMALMGKPKSEIDLVLTDFVDSFTKQVDLQKAGENLGINEDITKKAFEIFMSSPRNMAQLLAYSPVAPGKNPINKEAYDTHVRCNAFYDELSTKLAEKWNIPRSFADQTKGVNTYGFLEER